MIITLSTLIFAIIIIFVLIFSLIIALFDRIKSLVVQSPDLRGKGIVVRVYKNTISIAYYFYDLDLNQIITDKDGNELKLTYKTHEFDNIVKIISYTSSEKLSEGDIVYFDASQLKPISILNNSRPQSFGSVSAFKESADKPVKYLLQYKFGDISEGDNIVLIYLYDEFIHKTQQGKISNFDGKTFSSAPVEGIGLIHFYKV